jgi:GcrA cell cycle regulator
VEGGTVSTRRLHEKKRKPEGSGRTRAIQAARKSLVKAGQTTPKTIAILGAAVNTLGMEPKSLNVPLVALGEYQCRWPHGDPLTPRFGFCGHPTAIGKPYCPYHQALAWQPHAPRQRGLRRHLLPSESGRTVEA